jgi:hypothetical protein
LQFDDEEGKERAEEKICDWEKVVGPNLFGMIMQEGGSSSVLLVAVCEQFSYTFGWFAYTHEDPT